MKYRVLRILTLPISMQTKSLCSWKSICFSRYLRKGGSSVITGTESLRTNKVCSPRFKKKISRLVTAFFFQISVSYGSCQEHTISRPFRDLTRRSGSDSSRTDCWERNRLMHVHCKNGLREVGIEVDRLWPCKSLGLVLCRWSLLVVPVDSRLDPSKSKPWNERKLREVTGWWQQTILINFMVWLRRPRGMCFRAGRQRINTVRPGGGAESRIPVRSRGVDSRISEPSEMLSVKEVNMTYV